MASLHVELENNLQDSNATPMFLPLEFLKAITHNFSTESEIGRGGYGVVYKGVLRSGNIIAVKNLFAIHLLDDNTFRNEVSSLMEIKHLNVVQFIGYCAESSWETIKKPDGTLIWAEIPKRLLCFEYLCNESLAKYIYDESSDLNWKMRYEIIKGICTGLNFLHEECRLVHLDLKPENILMDATMIPKIADFGLSRMFGNQQSRIVTDNRVGSRGYMAPEYLNQGLISKKADIFSLGVIIIELITGGRDYPYFQLDSPQSIVASCHHYTEKVLESWTNKFACTLDKSSEKYTHQVKQCVTVALKCVDPSMERRPTAKDIIQVFNAVDQTEAQEELPPVTQCIDMLLVLNTNRDKHLPTPSVVEDMLINEATTSEVVDEAKSYGLSPMLTSWLSTITQNYQDGANSSREILSSRDTTTETATISPLIQIIDDTAGRIFSMDANQAEPLIITGDSHGHVQIWNYDTQKVVSSIEVSTKGVCCVKFILRKQWFVALSSDFFIHVYKYNSEMQKITSFKVHHGPKNICSLAVHPTLPYVLSGCDMQIKLWDWDQGWNCIQTFQEHSKIVSYVKFNPEDTNYFASASVDRTIKVWSLDSPTAKYTLSGHSGAVLSLDFFRLYGQQYLITGSYDNTAKIWDMQKKECIHSLEHQMSAVLSVLSHPNLPVLVTGTRDGAVHVWSSTNFRLKRMINISDHLPVTGFTCLMGSGRVAISHFRLISVIEIRDEDEQGVSRSSNENSISAAELEIQSQSSTASTLIQIFEQLIWR